MKQIFFGFKYLFNYHILNKRTPLICGLVLTNRCNLHCAHCRISDRGAEDLRFDEIRTVIHSFYRNGGRSIYFEGGEPFIWQDGGHGLEQVTEYAHRAGFLTVIIYTNGTRPLESSAEMLFISLDGLRETHDSLRGQSFDRIMENVASSDHPSLFVNFTINSRNRDELEAFCQFINDTKNIRGVFFYFHTPYYGIDDLYLEPGERREILLKILEYKTKYKILNSRAGLHSALRNDWKRPLDICTVYEKGTIYRCCRYSGNEELCGNCGYLSYAEIHQSLRLKPSALVNALQYYRPARNRPARSRPIQDGGDQAPAT